MENIEIKVMSVGDFDEILELSNKVFPEEYNVTDVRLKERMWNDSDRFEAGCLVIRRKDDSKLIGFIAMKLSNSELYPDTAWINILAVDEHERRKGYGRLLLTRAMDELKKVGVKLVNAGQEFHNLFSGIPNPDDGNIAFFKSMGFTINDGNHYDLETGIIHNDKIDNFDTSPFTDEFEVKTYHDDEYDKLMFFLVKEFPGRWSYEVDNEIKENHKDPSEVVLLWNKKENSVVGFCLLTSYKDADGKKTGYGGLGPIGIAKDIRGRELGNYLLHQALLQAERNGINRVNIDWTILVKFYGQFGFEAKRIYRAAYKQL